MVAGGLVENAGFGYNAGASGVVTSCPAVNPALLNSRTICVDTPGTVKLTDTVVFSNQWNFHGDGFDLRYITGGTHYHYQLTGDQDGTGVSQLTRAGGITYQTQYSFNYQEIERWWSHEINILSTGDGPLQWLVGGYFYNESYDQPVYTQLANESRLDGFVLATPSFGLAPVNDPLRRIYDDRPHFNIRSRAIFGQIDWKLNDQFKATVGLRYGTDHKFGSEAVRVVVYDPAAIATIPLDVTSTLGVPPAGQPLPTGVVTPTVIDPATGFASRNYNASWSAVTGTAGVEWQPDHDTMVFVKYSRGYKAGGFRVGIDTALSLSPITDKETVDSYELGIKKDFGRTLRTNIDFFLYNYNNAQVPLSQPATSAAIGAVSQSILFNVPRARNQGIELETTWQPIDNLQILFNYSYLDAHIISGTAIDPADPAALDVRATPVAGTCTAATCPADAFTVGVLNGGFQRFQNLAGNNLPNAAKHRFTINGNYTWRMDKGNLTGSLTYVWRGAQYGSIFNRTYYRAPSYSQVDGRFTWTAANDKYTVILFAKNMFNTLGYANGAGATRRAGSTGGVNTVFGTNTTYELTPPRTYGIELHYKFF